MDKGAGPFLAKDSGSAPAHAQGMFEANPRQILSPVIQPCPERWPGSMSVRTGQRDGG